MVAGPVLDAMVGRAEVLERLLDACREATRGRGSVVIVSGEAGVGKSRLCREVAVHAADLGFELAETRCWAHGGAPPLWPWREVLRQANPPSPAPPPGSPLVAVSQWPGLSLGFAVFEGAADRLRHACDRAPLLVILDDLHEADEGTLLLTRFLASQLGPSRLLLLASVRTGAVARTTREAYLLRELEQASSVIHLPGLDRDELGQLVSLSGRPADEPTLDMLVDITRGNPLIVQSVLRSAPPGPLGVTFPASVAEALALRMGSVDPAVMRVLARAAVLGVSADMDEVAALCRCSVQEVRDAVQVGVQLQVLRSVSPSEVTFTHDLVRAAIEATLNSGQRQDAHGKAAVVVGADPFGDGALRAAHHALRAAGRSARDLDAAVRRASVAAASLTARDAFNDAAALLAAAISVVERAGATVPAVLRIDLARAVLAAGRLAEAHNLYLEATQAAEEEDDPVVFAEAAVGLGGVWINDVRSPVEQARILNLQRAALAALPEGHGSLALRLRSRITTASIFWEAGSVEQLLEIVDEARTFGDPSTTLEVLSNAHVALLGPNRARQRLQLAEEMIVLAGAVSGGIFPLMARCWRTVDLYLVGSDAADNALADLRGPAEAMQCLSVLYIVRLMDTMLLLRGGCLEAAEQAALETFELGQQCQDADALAFYGVQLVAVRWLQGRDAEMLALFKDVAASANVIRGDHSLDAAVAVVAARSGQLDVARKYLGRVLAKRGLERLPMFSTWMATVAAVIETAAMLGDAATAETAYALLAPYARLPLMPSLAFVCFGSAELPLGLAARTMGRLDLAVEHIEAAVVENIRLGNLPRAALARVELASTLQQRNAPGDILLACKRLDEAIDTGTQLGLTDLTYDWIELRVALSVSPSPSSPSLLPPWASVTPAGSVPVITDRRLSIRRDDRLWVIELAGERIALPDRVGLHYLAQLVGNPGRAITAHELATGERRSPGVSRQPVLDQAARQALERRVHELASHIAAARDQSDVGMQAKLEDELDAITDGLRRSTGLARRDRYFGDDGERARTAVRKAVVRAINDIAVGLPAAGDLLRRSITTGSECCYDPDRADAG